LGFIGPKSEAEEIKKEIGNFLLEQLHLEMSEAKTLVTHAKTEKAHFLGYEVNTLTDNSRRAINGVIGLRVPREVIEKKAKEYTHDGKAIYRAERIIDRDYTIVTSYQSVYRGMVNYWKMAYNLREMQQLKWVMEQSLVKTLAAKHKTRNRAILKKYRKVVTIEGHRYKVLQVVEQKPEREPYIATWGGIPLAWSADANLTDLIPRTWNVRSEIIQRLLTEECEWCGDTEGPFEVHHVHRLKDLKGKTDIEKLLAARARKTMVLCKECHQNVTYGYPMKPRSGTGFMQNPKGWHRKHART
jgi:hypothetical protein